VERRHGIDEFLRDPIGSCIAAETWLYFYPDPALCGFALWGRVAERDMRSLVAILPVGFERDPHVVLADVRDLELMEPRAFSALRSHVREESARLARSVTRLAVLRASTMAGALVTGFFGFERLPFPTLVCEEPRRALEWLAVPGAAAMFAEIEHHRGQALDHAPMLRTVREYLRTNLASASLGSAATAIGTSERTLQRHLHARGTSFLEELNRARVTVAERLLLETDAKLLHIAFEVGCSSLPSFSALFRKLTGTSPSAWRTARRPSSDDPR
jgi:AraC-like DNA-binding protein